MATDRVVYEVVPDAGAQRWLVIQENGKVCGDFRTKDEAVLHARELADQAPLGQVKVQGHDSNMEYQSSHGEDSSPSPG